MKLKSIDIYNFKSIEHVNIPIKEINGSYTYALVGVNEAGKTSILTAIKMIDDFKPITKDDFHKDSSLIEVYLNYEIEFEEQKKYPDFKTNEISIGYEIDKRSPNSKVPIFKYLSKLGEYKKETNVDSYKLIIEQRHKIKYWTYSENYLLNKEISFTQQNAVQIINQNIPLNNCFKIAKISIEEFQKGVTDSIERKKFEKQLSTKVNELLKKGWTDKNIDIEFDLTDTKINFHIIEKNALKAEKINQRSDGFRQFLSFLLSILAESESENLSNTIILLDEPETHLHPQAQKKFLEEIINLTKSKNNVLFYSTHSGFLIDSKNIDRTAKITKNEETKKTEFKYITKEDYSFARINYEIFEAEAEGFHNELYDKLRDKFAQKCEKDFIEIKKFDEEYFKQEKKEAKNYPEKGEKNRVTLSTYVRNCIHYPINKNDKFNEHLKKSIENLKNWINEE
jgi:predicted ATP-dependent endonuclease of OLD family